MQGKTRDKRLKKKSVRLPARWLYRSALLILQFPVRIIFGVRIKRDPGLRRIKGPVIVLGNHPSYLDPFLAAIALPWLNINYVAASLFFRNRKLKKILDLLGVIPKTQFRSDAGALKQMLQVLKQKGALGIFPEGQRSIDGTRSPMDDTISRLIKKTGCSVITLRISGAYLTWPRWSAHGFRPGRIEIDAKLMMSADTVKKADAAQISKAVFQALDFNDYDWQRKRKRPASYLSLKGAEDLHNICHQCPVCKEIMSMRSRKNRLFCHKCFASWRIDRHGFFHNLKDKVATDTVQLDDVHAWRIWQRKQLAARLKQTDFSLSCNTETETAELSGAFAQDGRGVLRIDHSGFLYQGKDAAGSDITYNIPAGRTTNFSASYGRNLEMPHDNGAFRFSPANGQMVIMLADALALLDKVESEQ